MGYVTTKKTKASLEATTDSGVRLLLSSDVEEQKEYYPVRELTERCNLKNVFRALSEACKSSRDILLLGDILERANVMNEILIPNISELANELEISRKHLTVLLSRAEDVLLLHKLGTGKYLLNPYRIMGTEASKTGYQVQELIQVRWKEETGLFTEIELAKLSVLSNYLGLDVGLRPTTFNLSVAEYYNQHKTITDKQRVAVLKRS